MRGVVSGILRRLGRKAPFRAVVSLGGLCQVAYQVEHRFGFRVSSPFDWLVTPLSAVERILADDGAGFGREVTVLFDGGTAVCRRYGVAYHHDFPRTDDYKAIVSAEALEACGAKHRHKLGRLAAYLEGRPKTLFVRLAGHHDTAAPLPYVADPRPTTTADLNGLCEVLARRFPGLEFALLFVYYEAYTTVDLGSGRLDPRVTVATLPACDIALWQGETEAWAALFDRFDIAMERAENTASQYGEATSDFEVLHA
jgi:hypothetical protein